MACEPTDIKTACAFVKVNGELVAFFRYQQNTVYKPYDAKKS
jgi:hypothetical protein